MSDYTLSVFGGPVTVRDISREKIGCLDADEYRLAVTPREQYPMTVEGIRRSTGWENRCINEKELITEVLDLPNNGRTVRVWIYRPRKPFDVTDRKAFVYAHGGAFIAGTPFTDENLCRYLAEACDAVVFNVDYALAPELPYPNGVDDLACVLEYVHANAEKLGIDADSISVSGDSAGAMLMLAAVLRGAYRFLRYQALFYPCITLNYEQIPVPWELSMFDIPKEQLPLVEPRLNLGRSDGGGNPTYLMLLRSLYLSKGGDVSSADVSPLYGTLGCLPETRIFTCEFDGLRPQGEYLGMRLTEAGVKTHVLRYRGIFHAFTEKIGVLPHAKDAVDCIRTDLEGLV